MATKTIATVSSELDAPKFQAVKHASLVGNGQEHHQLESRLEEEDAFTSTVNPALGVDLVVAPT